MGGCNMKVKSVYKEYATSNESDHHFIGQLKNTDREVMLIEYHEPSGEGDAHYCDVGFKSGTVKRIFRPDTIEF
jgi:hypothetical protein